MNLQNDPYKQQLQTLLAAQDDEAGHHMLWTDKEGGVHIDLLPIGKGPIKAAANLPNLKLRYETFMQGNDYVGEKASKDDSWVDPLFNTLKRDWQKGITGYSDEIC